VYCHRPISNRNNLQTSVSKWSLNTIVFRISCSVHLCVHTDHRIYQPFEHSRQPRILCLGIRLFWNRNFHFEQSQSDTAAARGTPSICATLNRWHWACLSLDCASCFNDDLDWPALCNRIGLFAKCRPPLLTSKFSHSNNWSISVKMRIKQIFIGKSHWICYWNR
jgi:hypothetical protein